MSNLEGVLEDVRGVGVLVTPLLRLGDDDDLLKQKHSSFPELAFGAGIARRHLHDIDSLLQ